MAESIYDSFWRKSIPFFMLALTIAMAFGIFQAHLLDYNKQFVDETTWIEQGRHKSNKLGHDQYRQNVFIFEDSAKENIITQVHFLNITQWMINIMGMPMYKLDPVFYITYEGKRYDYNNLCYKPWYTNQCLQLANILTMFETPQGFDLISLNDSQVLERINSGTPPLFKDICDKTGIPCYIFPYMLFGTVHTTPEKITIDSSGINDIQKAWSTGIQLLFSSADNLEHISKMYEDALRKYFYEFFEQMPSINVYAQTFDGPKEVMKHYLKKDIPLIILCAIIAVLLNIIFSSFLFYPILSRVFAAQVGLVGTMMSVITCFGFLSFLDYG